MTDQEKNLDPKLTRRALLKSAGWMTAGAVAGFPTIVPRSVFGKNAPSNRITVGFIGIGRQAFTLNMDPFLEADDVTVLAVCDVDAWRLAQGQKKVEAAYAGRTPSGKYKGCAQYADFRQLLARTDIDAVMISTPDHWHVPMSLLALKAGKDVSCEKPLTLSIQEGRLLADTVKRLGRVFRTDSEFRSLPCFNRAVEWVLNGRIGTLHTLRTGVPKTDVTLPPQAAAPVPDGLDYESWLGPAPRAPYTLHRVHPPRDLKGRPGWMRARDYCEGLITNWGTHLNDIAQWGNGTDRTGPTEVEARGVYPPQGNLWNVLLEFEAHYVYANGVQLHYVMDQPYVRFEGDEGWIAVDYTTKKITASSDSILKSAIKPGEINLPKKTDKRDFIDAVKTRGRTMEDAEVGHRTCSLCQIAHIAIQLGGAAGKKLRWDPDTERFDDEAANQLLSRPSWRAPFTLESFTD